MDDSHIDPQHGHKVFDDSKKAVEKLILLLKDEQVSEDIKAVCRQAIDILIIVVDNLAVTAYEEAIEAYNNSNDNKLRKEIEKALEKCETELARAYEELEKDNPQLAIDHYKKVWEYAQ